MEGDHSNVEMNSSNSSSTSCGTGSNGAPAGSSRWNPTKEQINMLESLYKQGIRTPGAEQIQQITTRLRAFGHIEGKNVFYWFQNHKARQRQKQKQESMAYINRFVHRTTHPKFPSNSHPCPNVVCGPYYIPVVQQSHDHTGIHQQYQYPNKVPLSNSIRPRSPRLDKLEKSSTTTRIICCAAGAGYEPVPTQAAGGILYTTDIGGSGAGGFEPARAVGSTEKLIGNSSSSCEQETLPLFPVRPTGILQGKEENSHIMADDQNPATNYKSRVDQETCSSGYHDQPFYDFFSR